MNSLIIRKIKLGDHIGLKQNTYTDMDIEQIEKNVINNVKIMKNNGDWIYLVAELNSEVVGTTYVKFNGSPIEKHVAELFSVVVSNNHRKKGICRAMIDGAVKIAKKKNIEMIILSVREGTIADTVYKRIGFRSYGNLKNGIKEKDGYFNHKLYYLNLE